VIQTTRCTCPANGSRLCRACEREAAMETRFEALSERRTDETTERRWGS
jgi:hypothetical protein